MTRKQWFFRIFFYSIGIFTLALGVTLNTRTGLGVSPLISIPYTVAVTVGLNVGNTTFLFYVLVTLLQLVIRKKDRRWTDLLQIPFSIVFTRFMNLFSSLFDFQPQYFWQRFLILAFAILFTGIGATLSVNMKLIPNPCDGFVHMAGELSGKGMGFAKNIFDIINVGLAWLIGLIGGHMFAGIGIGTVITMIALGRVIALANRIYKEKTERLAGFLPAQTSS